MNAKKIMGAVLVALLAAALFVGAGAAAVYDQGTIFTYQNKGDNLQKGATYINGEYKITVGNTDDKYLSGDLGVLGTYTYVDGAENTYTFKVIKPTATYNVIGKTESNVEYIVANGGKVYLKSTLDFEVAPTGAVADYYLITPSGEKVLKSDVDELEDVTYLVPGTYSVQAIFDGNYFTKGADDSLVFDQTLFTFTVVDVDDATLSASVDSAYPGEFVTLTVEGTIGETYKIKLDGLNIKKENQVLGDYNVAGQYEFEMPNNGKVSFQASIGNVDEATAELVDVEDSKITINVADPVVTAELEKASYFVGDKIVIFGTSTAEATFTFYIEGTNFGETKMKNAAQKESGKKWKYEIPTEGITYNGKELDVGTYTVSVKQTINNKDVTVATVALVLKQPFLTLTEVPEVVVQNTKAEFKGTAEVTDKIYYYIFGTNFFTAGEKSVKKTAFTIVLEKTTTDNMSTGQYFMVVQHPMYDKAFNIKNISSSIYLNTTGEVIFEGDKQSFLFSVDKRQTANAAQALCDALDTQNIDDMYVKHSFIVVGEDAAFTINDIPAEVAQGSTFTVSGTSTAAAGKYVVVEMLSTAFAAVPKETVGSAAFIVLTTKVAEDGTWEVTFDTSDLNVDEYSLKIACENEEWKNVKVNVVAAEDKPVNPEQPENPENPEQPEEPVAPETPGFGALAALAGLGAVAVLLLRRE